MRHLGGLPRPLWNPWDNFCFLNVTVIPPLLSLSTSCLSWCKMPLLHSNTTGEAFCRQSKVKLSFSIIWEATDEATVQDDQEHNRRNNIWDIPPSPECWMLKPEVFQELQPPQAKDLITKINCMVSKVSFLFSPSLKSVRNLQWYCPGWDNLHPPWTGHEFNKD